MLLAPVLVLLMSSTNAFTGRARDISPAYRTTTRMRGSIEELYSGEPLDPNRRKLRLAFLSTSRSKQPPKTEKERQLDEKVWGRWRLEEESIDRPPAADLAKYGKKLKPTYSRFEEDLFLDMYNGLMLTKEDTCAFGMGWQWTNLKDVYSAPMIRFRINRKEVGIDFDEYESVDHMPSVSFYSGTFKDGSMDVIEGTIQRNRDAAPPEDGSAPVVVTVGTFRMVKVASLVL
ncbi:hypothetical protein NSK_000495 [Nannochloropsis salina CCMP1776]|uniref:Plastid lipid-associated protein/fibrillin conserved domain-containing protein n=1 Tax=Nannochloropsis salina CCMP1776 TaxID=1027361 RepID=A0A4D9D8W9_9STRA|nr:hypothetical protein NSK_000495 [Nannochloropsis salina CCMP1776]|eukprot:TFJ88141.1 hypothetical protein NSK_000495 [Nannochloropsis salina CCMP1776]